MSNNSGNCYVASEAIFHLTGGKSGPWRPHVCRTRDGKTTHWFLVHKGKYPGGVPMAATGTILDVTGSSQFVAEELAHLHRNGRGCGFLTRRPSRRAKLLMNKMRWQDINAER